MNTNRICLVGLPRCGSQYIASLISNTIRVDNLIEPFTKNHTGSLIHLRATSQYNKLKIKYLRTDIETQIDDALNAIETIPLDRPLLLKLFLVEASNNMYRNVMERLSKIGFNFIVIKRTDIFEHYLSLLLAYTTDICTNTTDGYFDDLVTIPLKTITDSDWFYFKLKQFDEAMIEFGLDTAPKIIYENAESDLSKILGKPLNLENIPDKKISSLKNSERITNMEDVMNHWNYLNALYISRRAYRNE